MKLIYPKFILSWVLLLRYLKLSNLNIISDFIYRGRWCKNTRGAGGRAGEGGAVQFYWNILLPCLNGVKPKLYIALDCTALQNILPVSCAMYHTLPEWSMFILHPSPFSSISHFSYWKRKRPTFFWLIIDNSQISD